VLDGGQSYAFLFFVLTHCVVPKNSARNEAGTVSIGAEKVGSNNTLRRFSVFCVELSFSCVAKPFSFSFAVSLPLSFFASWPWVVSVSD
jgi:hypothetical protein